MNTPKLNDNSTTLLYGLVLAGGHSKRMDKDKSQLNYHGKSQAEHCYELLSEFCEKVFISNREDQSNLDGHEGFPQIHDQYLDIGPLGGILTAFQVHPNVAWLVLACDLPLVDHQTINTLIENRDVTKIATAYKSVQKDHLPEPLCAIYEPQANNRLIKYLDLDIRCPRKILIESDVRLIDLDRKSTLDNINTEQDYQALIQNVKSFKND